MQRSHRERPPAEVPNSAQPGWPSGLTIIAALVTIVVTAVGTWRLYGEDGTVSVHWWGTLAVAIVVAILSIRWGFTARVGTRVVYALVTYGLILGWTAFLLH